jgi:hypothetical protein
MCDYDIFVEQTHDKVPVVLVKQVLNSGLIVKI